MIRSFAAIALPEAVRFELTLVGHGLPVPKPLPPENMHLTLVFLGELPEPVVADIDAAFASVRAPPNSPRPPKASRCAGCRPSSTPPPAPPA